jgi:hypothetical protein
MEFESLVKGVWINTRGRVIVDGKRTESHVIVSNIYSDLSSTEPDVHAITLLAKA